MRFLLDTHALLWGMGDYRKLSPAALAAISQPENEICVSPASGYEIAYKNHLGKLPLPEGYLARFSPQIQSRGFQVVPVRMEHMILAGQFRTVHRDPFDRIIAAQAVVENAVLISADPQFATFSHLVTLW